MNRELRERGFPSLTRNDITYHDDGKHANSPSPTNASWLRNIIDNKRRDPRHDEKGGERDSNDEATPARRRDIGKDDRVQDASSRLANLVKDVACGVRVDVLGRGTQDIREEVEGDGDQVRLATPNYVADLGDGWLDDGSHDGPGSGESAQNRETVEGRGAVVLVGVDQTVVQFAMKE